MEYDSNAPILLFRRWKAEPPYAFRPEFGLTGSWRGYVWPTEGPLEAECRTYHATSACQRGPLAQDRVCLCGFHGCYTFAGAFDHKDTQGVYGFVIGIIAAGGRVLFDQDHARAEIADVICLIDPIEYGPHIVRKGNYSKGFVQHDQGPYLETWAEKTAERYDVPMLSLADAIEYAHEFGVFVTGVTDTEEGEIVEGIDD